MSSVSPLIVALDYASAVDAAHMARRLDPRSVRLKVGKELFTAAGPELVRDLVGRGFGVFLDLKFHDIPNTVAGAVRAACELGVWMVNVHAGGGRRMMEAAVAAARASGAGRPLLTAVTVLTSFAPDELAETGVAGSIEEQVGRLARLAIAAGMDGVVCSGLEAAPLRAALGAGPLLVTPGIRPASSAADDQRRTMTPREALRAGSSHLVIGRPITGSADPAAAVEAILSEISYRPG